ncbi:unnamed protein product [Paramecium sonneborni]|uniref:Uncharacterized protein n=1 Tax=Paramecium sonneborni TaxID=65129 RepID=A0A8S1RDT3_9CILI|nr:unnamed protein product [Paramecium sonneborni]
MGFSTSRENCSISENNKLKIKKELQSDLRKFKEMIEQLKTLEQEIDQLDVQQKYEEADQKEEEHKILSKEKRALGNRIKNRKKNLAGLEQITKNNEALQEHNKFAVARIKEKNQMILELKKREKFQDEEEELDEELKGFYNAEELSELQDENYVRNKNKNTNLNQMKNQNQTQVQSQNEAKHDVQLQQNQINQQPQINQAQAFLQN